MEIESGEEAEEKVVEKEVPEEPSGWWIAGRLVNHLRCGFTQFSHGCYSRHQQLNPPSASHPFHKPPPPPLLRVPYLYPFRPEAFPPKLNRCGNAELNYSATRQIFQLRLSKLQLIYRKSYVSYFHCLPLGVIWICMANWKLLNEIKSFRPK